MRWLLILLPLFFAAANVAAHEPRALQFSYEIRLRDVAIGRTRMTVEPKKLVDGKLVRVLHSDGEALELAKAFTTAARATPLGSTSIGSRWWPSGVFKLPSEVMMLTRSSRQIASMPSLSSRASSR